jgi:DNA-binding TFAR19-related protein (PDSD5 family)
VLNGDAVDAPAQREAVLAGALTAAARQRLATSF